MQWGNRGFHKHMCQYWHLRLYYVKTKKSSDKMLPLVGIEPRPLITSDSKSSTLLSTLAWHVLLRRSLNFCSCTTWFFNLDDSVKINRTWLYKEPKVSVLQANVNLVQKGECWTWNQRLWEAQVLFPLRVTFFTGFFCFHVVKPLMPILALLPISSSLWKAPMGEFGMLFTVWIWCLIHAERLHWCLRVWFFNISNVWC